MRPFRSLYLVLVYSRYVTTLLFLPSLFTLPCVALLEALSQVDPLKLSAQLDLCASNIQLEKTER